MCISQVCQTAKQLEERIPLRFFAVSSATQSADRQSTPINIKLVLGVVLGAAVVIIGYGLLNSNEALSDAVAAPVVTGEALPEFANDPLSDGAVGSEIPVVSGTDFAGDPVVIEPDGRPKMLLFLAHWCSHCRAEVPLVQQWVNDGGLPSGIDLVAIATSIDSGRDNFPPDRWLENENWTNPVLADTTNEVGRSFGLSGFPYWVFVDGDGRVLGRLGGGLPVDQLNVITEALSG